MYIKCIIYNSYVFRLYSIANEVKVMVNIKVVSMYFKYVITSFPLKAIKDMIVAHNSFKIKEIITPLFLRKTVRENKEPTKAAIIILICDDLAHRNLLTAQSII